MSNFEEKSLGRIKQLEREVERLKVKESPGAWLNWTPTFTASSGTFADTSGSFGSYCVVGKVMHISIYFNIVDKGTASGTWAFTLPSGFTCSVSSTGSGREILLTGKTQQLIAMSASNTVTVRNYDNSSSIETGHAIVCSITLGI